MKNNKKSKRFSWSALFGNNRFILVFSLFLSFCLWIILMYNNTDENQTWKIDNVPITVEYTTGAVETGYKVYDMSKSAVSVSISGNSLSTRQIKAENIEVVATVTEAMQKGENTISLSARKKSGVISDFNVANIDPGTITAYIDIAKEKTLPLDNKIDVSVQENYYMKPAQFENENITISGPETEINKVASAAAEFSFDAPISETKEFSANIVLYDEDGKEIKNNYILVPKNTVMVKIPVLWQQSVTFEATFSNRPSLFSNKLITVTPASAMFAGQKESFDNLSSITLSPVDFSKVSLTSTSFSIPIVTPDGFTNISNEKTATINLNLAGYAEKVLVLSDIAFVNTPVDKTAELYNSSIYVTVVGPSADIEGITSSDITAQINLAAVTATGTSDLPLTISLKNNNTCWIYGSYRTTVNITDS